MVLIVFETKFYFRVFWRANSFNRIGFRSSRNFVFITFGFWNIMFQWPCSIFEGRSMSKYQLLLSKHIAPYCTLEKYRVVRGPRFHLRYSRRFWFTFGTNEVLIWVKPRAKLIWLFQSLGSPGWDKYWVS